MIGVLVVGGGLYAYAVSVVFWSDVGCSLYSDVLRRYQLNATSFE